MKKITETQLANTSGGQFYYLLDCVTTLYYDFPGADIYTAIELCALSEVYSIVP